MFRNYLKIALRNLLKNKTYSAINIFGLAIAFLCSMLLFLTVNDELTFDNFHVDKDRIYKVYNYTIGSEGERLSSAMSYPVAPTLKAEISEIIATSRFINWAGGGLEYKNKQLELSTNLVDEDFLKIFTFPVTNGNALTPLKDIGNAVISEDAAKNVFNTENPIGKTIKVKVMGEWKDLVVSAVVKLPSKNSSIEFDVLARTEISPAYQAGKTDWNNQHHTVYAKLSTTATQHQIEKKLRGVLKKHYPIDSTFMKDQGYKADANGDYLSLRLLPISELHFHDSLGEGNFVVSKSYIYTLLLIGFFILAIACFNFINLSIAKAFTRVKEVGVRKCLGANRKQVFTQIWSESLFVCVISLLIAIFGAIVLFPYFNQIFGARLSLDFFYRSITVLMVLAGTLIVSFVAGGYPAYVVSKLNTISVLKGSFNIKRPGVFRNALVVLQFSMAALLMICTIVAYKQFEYMRTMPLGFNKESVISIPLYNRSNGRNTLNQFRLRLASHSSVIGITGSNINIGLGKDGNTSKHGMGFGYKDKGINTNWMSVDYDFAKTLGMKLIAGRDFSKDYVSDTTNAVIVTESTAKQFTSGDPIGITFSTDTTKPNWTIVGVIPDFHLYSLHEKSEPLTMDISSKSKIGYVFIKTNSKNPFALMEQIKAIYKELEPGKEFLGTFMDDNTDKWYEKEKRFSLLLATSAVIAIVLSCLGLFALALLMIQQRIKEIGVRKVLGASVLSINNLLAKDFLKLVVLALIIASPVAWWLMNKWLQDFPYKITIGIFVFVAVASSAIIISMLTISYNTMKAALTNPVKSLRTE